MEIRLVACSALFGKIEDFLQILKSADETYTKCVGKEAECKICEKD